MTTEQPPRFSLGKHTGPAFRALVDLEMFLMANLEPGLIHLVKLRVSQINGCAYCIDMHWKDARAAGDTEARLALLPAWRESPSYTDRERAALAWAEAVTNLAAGHVSDEVHAEARTQFDERELAVLTYAVAAINTWNRLAIASRQPPGHYTPKPAAQAAAADALAAHAAV